MPTGPSTCSQRPHPHLCQPASSSWFEWKGRKEEPHPGSFSLSPIQLPPSSGLLVEVSRFLPGDTLRSPLAI